jgi:hypothetical protein
VVRKCKLGRGMKGDSQNQDTEFMGGDSRDGVS